MDSFEVSLCIPTYNFGRFIGDTLESIRWQISAGVEVVILDGGSTDDTADVVALYETRIPNLRYYRQGFKGGIDRDIARSVELAKGKYCWLFSSDDVLQPGALTRVLRETQSGHDLYLLGRMECTLDMRPLRKSAVLAVRSDAEFDLTDHADRVRYFTNAQGTYAFFAYMSSIVCRKAKWDEVGLDERYVGSCWAHVARLFALIPLGLRLKYLSEALVLCRRDNDSFLSGGVARRMGITVQGYQRMASEFFGENSVEAREIRRALRREHGLVNLLALKARAYRSDGAKGVRNLSDQVSMLYRDAPIGSHISRALFEVAPAEVLNFAHRTYKALSLG